ADVHERRPASRRRLGGWRRIAAAAPLGLALGDDEALGDLADLDRVVDVDGQRWSQLVLIGEEALSALGVHGVDAEARDLAGFLTRDAGRPASLGRAGHRQHGLGLLEASPDDAVAQLDLGLLPGRANVGLHGDLLARLGVGG